MTSLLFYVNYIQLKLIEILCVLSVGLSRQLNLCVNGRATNNGCRRMAETPRKVRPTSYYHALAHLPSLF